MSNRVLQGCPNCKAKGKRCGRWKVYRTPQRYLFVCPYCKFVISFYIKCKTCGDPAKILGKAPNTPVIYTAEDLISSIEGSMQ